MNIHINHTLTPCIYICLCIIHSYIHTYFSRIYATWHEPTYKAHIHRRIHIHNIYMNCVSIYIHISHAYMQLGRNIRIKHTHILEDPFDDIVEGYEEPASPAPMRDDRPGECVCVCECLFVCVWCVCTRSLRPLHLCVTTALVSVCV